MKIVLVDSDHMYSRPLSEEILNEYPGSTIERYSCEFHYLNALKGLSQDPPSLIIMETMLPWCWPHEIADAKPCPQEGYHLAASRCILATRAIPALESTCIIVNTVCCPNDVYARLEGLQKNVFFVSKDGSPSNLFRFMSSLALSDSVVGSNRVKIFVVHGHDDEAKETVARFVEKLGGRAIVLHEQPSLGRAIIEKFEHYANVSFAIVLLTPDDVGGKSPKSLKRRARQNVVFELGFFLAKLGRNKVCALHKEDVEIPSDIQGVIYTPMDKAGAWRTALARELKAAGIPLDYDKVI